MERYDLTGESQPQSTSGSGYQSSGPLSNPKLKRLGVLLGLIVAVILIAVAVRRWQANYVSSEFKEKANQGIDALSRAVERMYDGSLLYAPVELEAEKDVQDARNAAHWLRERELADELQMNLDSIGESHQNHWRRFDLERLEDENRRLDAKIAGRQSSSVPERRPDVTSAEYELLQAYGICLSAIRERLDSGGATKDDPKGEECYKRRTEALQHEADELDAR